MIRIKNGFTLIEILLVIVIIGIIGGIIFVALGNQRNRARFTSARATASSLIPMIQECLFNQEPLRGYTNDRATGYSGLGTMNDKICNGSITQWPELAVEECGYNIVSQYSFSVNCGSSIGSVTCDAGTGQCVVN